MSLVILVLEAGADWNTELAGISWWVDGSVGWRFSLWKSHSHPRVMKLSFAFSVSSASAKFFIDPLSVRLWSRPANT